MIGAMFHYRDFSGSNLVKTNTTIAHKLQDILSYIINPQQQECHEQ